MPTYEYKCRECGDQLEVVQSFTDDALTKCPTCKRKALRKVFRRRRHLQGQRLLQDRQPARQRQVVPSSSSPTESTASSDRSPSSKARRRTRQRQLGLDERLVVHVEEQGPGSKTSRAPSRSPAVTTADDRGVRGFGLLLASSTTSSEVEVDTPYGAPSAPCTSGRSAAARWRSSPATAPTTAPAAHGALPGQRLGAAHAGGTARPRPVRRRVAAAAASPPATSSSATSSSTAPRAAPTRSSTGRRVNHVSFADPYCPELRAALVAAAPAEGITVHDGGTVVVVQGPRFSPGPSRRWYGRGLDVINMTQYPEAALARELGHLLRRRRPGHRLRHRAEGRPLGGAGHQGAGVRLLRGEQSDHVRDVLFPRHLDHRLSRRQGPTVLAGVRFRTLARLPHAVQLREERCPWTASGRGARRPLAYWTVAAVLVLATAVAVVDLLGAARRAKAAYGETVEVRWRAAVPGRGGDRPGRHRAPGVARAVVPAGAGPPSRSWAARCGGRC